MLSVRSLWPSLRRNCGTARAFPSVDDSFSAVSGVRGASPVSGNTPPVTIRAHLHRPRNGRPSQIPNYTTTCSITTANSQFPKNNLHGAEYNGFQVASHPFGEPLHFAKCPSLALTSHCSSQGLTQNSDNASGCTLPQLYLAIVSPRCAPDARTPPLESHHLAVCATQRGLA